MINDSSVTGKHIINPTEDYKNNHDVVDVTDAEEGKFVRNHNPTT